jgi:hypothetical protein
VQPLLRQRCVSCHGPTPRLDRRRDAMRGSTFGTVQHRGPPGTEPSPQESVAVSGGQHG